MLPVRAILSIAPAASASVAGSESLMGGPDSVLQQHRDRQRSYPAGNRRQGASDLLYSWMHVAKYQAAAFLEGGVALRARRKQRFDERAVFHLRGADVDHRRARLDELRGDERCPSQRSHQDVR